MNEYEQLLVDNNSNERTQKLLSFKASFVVLNKLSIHCVKEYILSFISGIDALCKEQYNKLLTEKPTYYGNGKQIVVECFHVTYKRHTNFVLE